MDIDFEYDVALAAADTIEMVLVEEIDDAGNVSPRFTALFRQTLIDIKRQHPDLPMTAVAFAHGVAVGRCQGRLRSKLSAIE